MSTAEVYDYGVARSLTRFAEWVENAVSGADYLRDQLDGIDDLARLLTVVRDAQAKLAMLHQETERDLAEAVRAGDDREPQVPGVGVLKLNRRKRQEWDSTRLFASLTARACSSDDPEAAVLDILGACLPLTKSLGWRSTGLKECGLDPDEYRATEHKGWRVQITEPDG